MSFCKCFKTVIEKAQVARSICSNTSRSVGSPKIVAITLPHANLEKPPKTRS